MFVAGAYPLILSLEFDSQSSSFRPISVLVRNCNIVSYSRYPSYITLSSYAVFKVQKIILLHFGGDDRDRTDDLLRARQALSQLSYTPEVIILYFLNIGGHRWTRTTDLTLIRRAL